MLKACLWLLNISLLFFLTRAVYGQNEALTIPFSPHDKTIDADFSDWQTADCLKISNFIQITPVSSIQPSQKTEVFVCYSAKNLLFFIRCYDDRPDKIAATSRERDSDAIDEDDSFHILLDTYGTKSRAYYFAFNPLGTQFETTLLGGGSMYADWDGKWFSAARIDSSGWVAEIAIPFQSIQYSKKVWSMQLGRYIARQQEFSCWKLTETFRNFRDMGYVKLADYELIKRSSWLYLTPSPVASINDFTTSDQDLGVLLRIQPSENTDVDVTVNPDYAEIEADVDYIDLDRLPLFLSEKRDFFMRDREYMYDPLKIFYTRSIQDIDYGAKLGNKFLNGDVVFNSWLVKEGKENLYFANRLNYYPYKGQGLGLLIVSSSKEDSLESTSGSFDGNLTLPLKTQLNFQAALSTYRQGDSTNDDYAFLINPYRIIDEGFDVSGYYKKIGKNFNSLTGYIPQKGVDLVNLDVGYIFRFSESSSINHIYTGVGTNYWETEGIGTEKREFYLSLSMSTKDNIYYALDLISQDRKTIYGDSYYNRLLSAYAGYSLGGWKNISLAFDYGSYWDGILYYPRIGWKFKPCKTLNLSLSMDYYNVVYEDEPDLKEVIVYSRGEWEIFPKFSLKTFLQWSDLYKEMDINLLLKYDFFAGSHVYLAYNDVRALNSKGDREEHYGKYDFQSIRNQMLFKFTYQIAIL
jgi:hypothetical protein